MVKLKLIIHGPSEEEREWVEIPEDYEPTKEEKEQRLVISIPERFKEKLDNVRILQKRNLDAPMIFVGPVGSGKSTLIKLSAWYCSRGTLTINNFVAGKEAISKLQQARDGSDVIFDESVINFSASDAMKEFSKQLVKVFSVIRQKRLRIWLAIPDFFGLHKYIAVFRSLFVCRCYFTPDFKQGRFAYWGSKRKAQLYEMGKKNYGSFAKPKSNFISTFPDFTLPFEKEYEKLKRQALQDAFDGDTKPQKFDIPTFERNLKINLFKQCYTNGCGSIEKLSKGFGISKRTGINWLHKEVTPQNIHKDNASAEVIDTNYNLNGKEEFLEEEDEEDDAFDNNIDAKEVEEDELD